LFGEKYGEKVRVVTIGDGFSKELCGGTHVKSTGQIGSFIIIEETAIASGVRRIEAITGEVAYNYIREKYITPLEEIKALLKKPLTELPVFVQSLIEQNANLTKQLDEFQKEKAMALKETLKQRIVSIQGVNFIAEKVDIDSSFIKDLAFAIRNEVSDLFLILGNISENKVNLTLMISDNLVSEKNWNASQIIREFAKEIQGGGGGQNYYATAGGKKVDGLENAFILAKKFVGMNHEQ
jgi:alanyl-tRNA synthetase